ncbi:hypothetical protein J6590_100261 [Homalodisca vitripennis]|nr:hypothetical protein J6590_100261 [Homalodisca vitripennis]
MTGHALMTGSIRRMWARSLMVMDRRMEPLEGSRLAGLYLPVELTLGTAKTDVSLKLGQPYGRPGEVNHKPQMSRFWGAGRTKESVEPLRKLIHPKDAASLRSTSESKPRTSEKLRPDLGQQNDCSDVMDIDERTPHHPPAIKPLLQFQFTFLLVQRLESDAVTDLIPEFWSPVRIKRSKNNRRRRSSKLTIDIVSTSEAPGLQNIVANLAIANDATFNTSYVQCQKFTKLRKDLTIYRRERLGDL